MGEYEAFRDVESIELPAWGCVAATDDLVGFAVVDPAGLIIFEGWQIGQRGGFGFVKDRAG